MQPPHVPPFTTGYNEYGQLGAGASIGYSYEPLEVAGSRTFRSISAGTDFTCALDEQREAWCWGVSGDVCQGCCRVSVRTFETAAVQVQVEAAAEHLHMLPLLQRGDSGQLGSGSLANQSVPVPVMGGRSFAAISTGNFFTCALAADGLMWFWGKPAFWSKSIYEPMKVGDGRSYAALTAASVHTCGLDNSGKLWCFGKTTSTCRLV